MKINSKSRTRRIIALTWIIPAIVASPYVFCKTFAFTITSQYGTISRQICNDRFDEIDVAMYGDDPSKLGSFRKGYFIFLFCVIYLLPSIVILTTCVKIAISLLQPITVENSVTRRKDKGFRHEENKRKVTHYEAVSSITWAVPGGGGQGCPDPPPPLKNLKNIGILCNSGPDPLKNHKKYQGGI